MTAMKKAIVKGGLIHGTYYSTGNDNRAYLGSRT